MLTEPDDPDSPPSLIDFSADGIFHQADYDGVNGIGTWEATGPSSAALTFVQQFTDDEGEFGGSATIRATIEVGEDGQSFSAQYTLELGGEGAPEGEYGPGDVTATRIAVEPMGTPAGSLEDLFGQFEEGTEPASEDTAIEDTAIATETSEAAPPTTS